VGEPLRPGDVSGASLATVTFQTGQTVTVRELPVTGHVRTPWYVRGRTGRVVGGRGRWPNPELLAYGQEDPDGTDVFAVEFEQHHLWSSYEGPAHDLLVLDLCAHWLEDASDLDADVVDGRGDGTDQRADGHGGGGNR